jgi:hypothetical protein
MLRTFLPIGYRNIGLSDRNVPKFGRINLLVGPNNSGKSNFIRGMGFARDLLLSEGGPTKFLNTVERHGRAETLNRTVAAKKAKGQAKSDPEIAFYWILDGSPEWKPDHLPKWGNSGSNPSTLVYFVGYRVGDSASFPSGFYLEHEALKRFVGSETWPTRSDTVFNAEARMETGSGVAKFDRWLRGTPLGPLPTLTVKVPVSMNETIFGQKDALLKDKQFYETMFPEFSGAEEELLTFARGFRTYSSTDLDVRQLAEGAKIDLSVRALDAEGSEFVNVLRYLDQKYDFLDEYAERLRELMPDLKRLKVIDASDTYKQLELHIGGHKYKPREMSDGTLKALWLALLLFSPERGSVLSIDEPEMNFHPAWLKVIGRWLQRFTSAEQLFVSTHSPDLLDTFTEGFKSGEVALFVFGLGDKEMRRVEPAALESFFKDGWELGDLYRVGEPQLGGWPW